MTTRPVRGIAAAIACISIVGIGLSLMIPLLSLELERRGVSGTMIGLQTAAQAAASIGCAFVVPRLIGRLGPRRLLLAAIATAVGCVLSFPFVDDTRWWFPLRMVLGAALTVLFIVSEYWITGVAEAARRGLVMGIYATFLSLGFAAGPAVLAIFGSIGVMPYVVGAVILAVGAVPVALGGGDVPPVRPHGGGLPLLAVMAMGPVAVLAAFAFGAIESSAFSFLAIWGQRSGFAEREAALLLTVSFLGNVALQVPLGLAADRLPKGLVLAGCALAGTVGAVLAPLVVTSPIALGITLFLWGGLVAGLYTVGLAFLAERFRAEDLASANAAFVLNYSLGSLIGPPAAGLGLELWNPHGFMAVAAAFAAAFAVLVIASLRTRP